MNQRFQASLANDPDLSLTVSLTNVLIFNVKKLTFCSHYSFIFFFFFDTII